MEKQYFCIDDYTMKCRLYPNKSQAAQIDKILHALHVYHNNIIYDMRTSFMCCNEKVGNDGQIAHFPDWKELKSKEFVNGYKKNDDRFNCIPSASLTNKSNSIIDDIRKSLQKTGNHPIEQWGQKYINKKDEKITKGVAYYTKSNPRRSYYASIMGSAVLEPGHKSLERQGKGNKINRNILYVRTPYVDGHIKIRGWNQNIRFKFDNKEIDFPALFKLNKRKAFLIRIIKDNCGDYFICFSLSFKEDKKTGNKIEVYKPVNVLSRKDYEFIDVGEITLGTLSDGTEFENIQTHNPKIIENINKVQFYNRKLSRSQGWSNIGFRKEHEQNKNLKPSKNYQYYSDKKRRVHRKIQRQRKDYYNKVSLYLSLHTQVMGTETLKIKEMQFKKKENENKKDKPDNKKA